MSSVNGRNRTVTIDWNTGSAAVGVIETGARPRATITVSGDWAPMGPHVAAIRNGAEKFYGNLHEIVRECDASIVNIEGVLHTRPARAICKDGDHIRISGDLLELLPYCSKRIACLANNHIMDYGLSGLHNTIQVLKEHAYDIIGISSISDSRYQPCVVSVHGYNVGIINVAEAEEATLSAHGTGANCLYSMMTQSTIESLRESVDIVLAVVHAGREFLPVPAPHIQAAYRNLIEQGCDVVIGHHPHVPQGMESWENGVIVYSTGNFVFWMDDVNPMCRIGYIVHLDIFDRCAFRVRMRPYTITEAGIVVMDGDRQDQFFQTMRRLSGFISEEGALAEIWGAYADEWLAGSGRHELAEAALAISGPRAVLRAACLDAASRHDGGTLRDRAIRRILWPLVHRMTAHDPAWRDRWRGGNDARRHVAAKLRNRFDTETHRQLYLTALGRLIEGRVGTAPLWAYDLIASWQALP